MQAATHMHVVVQHVYNNMQVHIHMYLDTHTVYTCSVYRVSLGIENNTCIYMYMYRQVSSKRPQIELLIVHTHTCTQKR